MNGTTAYRDLKHYFKVIKSLLPTYGKPEKKFLSDFIAEANDYADTHPSKSCEQIVAHFGEPNVIVANYLAGTNPQYLSKRIATAKYIKGFIAIVLILAVVATTVFIAMKYQYYKDAREAIVSVHEINIDPDIEE